MPPDPVALASPPANRRRLPVRGGAAALLLLPAVAMQFTREVQWTASDFMAMGALLATVCGLHELGARLSRDTFFRAGVGVAAFATFLQLWLDLAVGIHGPDDGPIGITLGVLAVALAGAILARLRADRLVYAMGATAIAQLVAGVYGLCIGVWQALALGVALAGLWLAAAMLFHRAAHAGVSHAVH